MSPARGKEFEVKIVMFNLGSWWKYWKPETVVLPYGDKVTKWLFWLTWESAPSSTSTPSEKEPIDADQT